MSNPAEILHHLEYKRTLRNQPNSLVLLTTDTSTQPTANTLVTLSPLAIPFKLHDSLLSRLTIIETSQCNAQYSQHIVDTSQSLNAYKMEIQQDVKPVDLTRYAEEGPKLLIETPQLYKRVERYLTELKTPDWVTNLLNGTQETDRVIGEIPGPDGYKLVAGLKRPFEAKQKSISKSMDFLAFVQRRDLRSLRDLRADHIPLLVSIKDHALKTLKRRYEWAFEDILVFLHYYPSTFHLHLHFTHLEDSNNSTDIYRVHLLSTVINNLQLCSDYYIKSNLTVGLKPSEPLYKLLTQSD